MSKRKTQKPKFIESPVTIMLETMREEITSIDEQISSLKATRKKRVTAIKALEKI